MATSLKVSLVEGVDRQQFVDSFENSVTLLLFSDDNLTDLYVSVEDSYVDTFSQNSKIVNVTDVTEHNIQTLETYPPTPSERSVSGHLRIASEPDSDTIKFGGQYINFDNYSNSDAAGPHRLQNPKSTRQPFGAHAEDKQTADPSAAKTYKSKFFGENVDILIWESATHPLDNGFIDGEPISPIGKHVEANLFPAINHPDLSTMASSNNMLDFSTGDGSASTGGPYATKGATRVKLRNWTTPLSSGSSVGSRGALKSRYENTNLTRQQRSAITAHCIGAMSAAGGLIGGFAKKANLYPFYDLKIGVTRELDIIIKWHKSKERNPNVKYGSGKDLSEGVRNPTIVVGEFGSTKGQAYFVPVENINTLKHKGETVSRPAGGWGSNLQPFVDMNIIPQRIQDPDNPDTFYWAAPYGEGGENGVNTKVRAKIEEAWNAGIIMVMPMGNNGAVIARRDEVEYNSNFIVDKSSYYFEAVYDSTSGRPQLTRLERKSTSSKRSKKVYPFRANYLGGTKRSKAIEVAAGQSSETHPILDYYSARGPGTDIIGSGDEHWTAYPSKEFKADSDVGSNADLDPNSSMWDSNNPYPFEVGEALRVDNLGSGGLYAWTQYLGTPFIFHSDNRPLEFEVPATHPANIPPGAKVSTQGYRWGTYGGTSCAAPSVAGKVACIVEEFLHDNKRWPSPNEAKNILIGQARKVDAEAPSTTWTSVPPAAFGRTISTFNHDKYIFSPRNRLSLPNTLSELLHIRSDFASVTGELKPDVTGWEAKAHGSTTLSAGSIGSIKSASSAMLEIHTVRWNEYRGFTYLTVKGSAVRPLIDGDSIIIRGVNGMTELNGNTYYVQQTDPNTYKLFTDQNLTTKLDASGFSPFTRTGGLGTIGFDTVITAADSAGFKDSSNSPIDIHLGALITVSNAGAGLNNGTYIVSKVLDTNNPPAIEVQSLSTSLDSNYSDDTAVTSFGSTVFTLSQPILEVTDNGVVVKLKNPSAGTAAGIEARISSFSGTKRLSVDCDNTVGIKIIDADDDGVEFNSTNIVAQGTLVPGEARTTVNIAATNSEGLVGNAKLFDQLSTASFDFDGNGTADALTDGLLLLRYLFALRGNALVEDAIAPDSPMTAEEVEDLLRTSKNIQDIDGDGRVDALTDGLLLLRYLFELRDDALISGAISPGANRTTGDEIVEYIERLMPEQAKVATYGFRKSNESAVPHSRSRQLQNTNHAARTTDYFVDLGDTRVQEDYNIFTGNGTPVGVFQWDSKYFNIPKYTASGTNLDELTMFPGAAWRWLKTNGGLWTANMGTLTATSTGNTTFVSASGLSTYEITDLWWTEGQREWIDSNGNINPRSEKGILCFAIKGTSIPNNETVFGSLDIAGRNFDRKDAFYYPDSNGNTVWWWEISNAPIQDCDFSALGESSTAWALHREAKQANTLDVDLSSGPKKLLIQNNNTSANYETIIKGIRVDQYPLTDAAQLCAIWTPATTKDQESYDYTACGTYTDLAGTPPLRAVYRSEGLDKDFESLKSTRTYKPTKRTVATEGASYPPISVGITAENDVSDIELGKEVTKFGYNRKASDVNTAAEEELTTDIEPELHDDPPAQKEGALVPSETVPGFYTDDSAPIVITGSLSAPTVPVDPAVFHVGDVVASLDTDSQDPLPIKYQWQISSNGSSWTDISTTDTVYTNSNTPLLTVRGYTGQSPAGDYYRCKVSTRNNDMILFTNAVQAVAE